MKVDDANNVVALKTYPLYWHSFQTRMTAHCLKQKAIVQLVFDDFSKAYLKKMANHRQPIVLYITANTFDKEFFITVDDSLGNVL